MEKENRILIGVYDGLREGGEAHYPYMNGAKYVGTYYTEPEYSLYHLSRDWPGLKTNGSTSILLEIYEVSHDSLKNIDYYEGFNMLDPYLNIYTRISIDTPFGKCFIYEHNRLNANKPLIECGDWLKYKKNLKNEVSNIKIEV